MLGISAAIGIIAWIAAVLHLRNPVNHDPRADFRQLQRHAAWLEERLDRARREHWDPLMITSLSNQLGDACRRLAEARHGVIETKSARVR
jgi:hypothetical protein